MATTSSANLECEEVRDELRESLLVAVSRVVEHEMSGRIGAFEELEDGTLEVERQVVHMLTELLLQKSAILFTDMQCFAKHGKRSVINTDDVKLCFRRQPEILKKLQDFEETLKNKQTSKKKCLSTKRKQHHDENDDEEEEELFF